MSHLGVKFSILSILISAAVAFGKEPAHRDQVMIGLRAGHNAVLGNFSALSLQTQQSFHDKFLLDAGIQYNTIGKIALEACPSYDIRFDWGGILPEAMIAYTNFSSINSLAIGAGAEAYFGWGSAKAGYYYHLYGSDGSMISEPFNIYYEFCVDFLHKVQNWALELIFTNCENFELDRHYQPSFIAQCQYNIGQSLSLALGFGYKPSGMFNISADYYQAFIKTGLCYRW